MSRLGSYLTRNFAADALMLLAIAAGLLFLIQSVRSFDVISVRGQDIGTLIGQVLLALPTLVNAFFHVCIGIGLARALNALQGTQELHIIHSSRRTPALFRAIAAYALGASALALLLTHVIEPSARRALDLWTASIAADLVGRTMTPQRFTEVARGVTVFIASRGDGGELTGFFADDTRTRGMRRTYEAANARVAIDDDGYMLRLANGSIQYLEDNRRFSQISFDRYDLPVEGLTGSAGAAGSLDGVRTLELLTQHEPGPEVWTLVGRRFETPARILAICLMVAAMAAFPHGRRRGWRVPIEITLLVAVFVERGISDSVPSPIPYVPVSGAVVMLVLAALVLLAKLRRGALRYARAPA